MMWPADKVWYKYQIDWLTDWGLMALSAHTKEPYRAFDKNAAVNKSEINEKVDNVKSWEYIK